MTYKATIIADSTAFGTRLTSMEVTFPRFLLAEFNTHRMFSRNSASSRAIPVETRIAQVRDNPFVPEAFTKNKRGMQAEENIASQTATAARETWLVQLRAACDAAEQLALIEVHKQHANRLPEPFCWHTVVVTATEWSNFFALRCHPAAQPEMQKTARLMKEAYDASTPRELAVGEWHLPYITTADHCVDTHEKLIATGLDDAVVEGRVKWRASTREERVKISVARCAAVSFERQHVEKAIEQYVARHDEMLQFGHMSPFEHQAQVVKPGLDQEYMGELDRRWFAPFTPHWRRAVDSRGEDPTHPNSYVLDGYFCGNFRAPFLQYRKMLPNEAVFQG